jgi:4-alpha-glucanotransferase
MALHEENIPDVFMRMAYASVANVAIIPMQDILGLNESARMNKPATSENNWTWRLLPEQLTASVERRLQEMTILYNRQ